MTALLALALALAAAPAPLVEVPALVPDALVDLRYATSDNFMKKQVYPKGARCLLVEPAARQLAKAATALREQGLRLRLYDCYRPRSVQWELWKVMPRPGYVADPRTGSHHNRGAAVDVGLAAADGGAVELPSGYDFFGPAGHHGYQGESAEARANRERLKAAMEAAGFRPNRLEWWHYELPQAARFPLRDEPFDAVSGDRAPAAPGPAAPGR